MKATSAKLYNWATQKASSKFSLIWVGVLFALELVLFVPLDPILMFFCLQKREKTFYYILAGAIASAFSGLLGYCLGHFLWDLIGSYIVPHLISASLFDRVAYHFQEYGNWAVFLGSLLPFPLKALSVSAGVFHLNLTTFICCLLTARLLRFFLVGGAMFLWGESVKNFLNRHFHRIIILIGAKIAATLAFFWILAQ